MGKVILKPILIGLTAAMWLGLGNSLDATAQDATGNWSAAPEKKSFTESVSSSFKSGVAKIGKALDPTPPPQPAEDPISLSTKSEPTARLYVSMARLQEKTGKLADAELHYQKALKHTPNYLGALLGYAQLKDRTGRPQEALDLFRQAAKHHPKHPSVYNNLALLYNRHGQVKDAVTQLRRAIALEPARQSYRNNMAVMLVKLGRTKEAFEHLRIVHSEAAAYYNLGYLLYEKGDKQAASQHFAVALRRDASLVQARKMLMHMSATASRPQQTPAAANNAGANRVGVRSPAPGTGYSGSRRPVARQLPPAPRSATRPSVQYPSQPGRPRTGMVPSPQRTQPVWTPPSAPTPTRIAPATNRNTASAPMPSGTYRPRTTVNPPLPR